MRTITQAYAKEREEEEEEGEEIQFSTGVYTG